MVNQVLDFSMQASPQPEANMLSALVARFEGLVYRCLIDEAWTMQFMSDGCFALTGYTPQDFMVRHVLRFEDLIHPDDRAATRARVLEAMVGDGRFSAEYRIVRRDGVVCWVREHGAGVRNANGRFVALEGFVQDVTRRRLSERAMHEAERRYRNIFENAVEGIYQSTVRHGFLAVNPALAHMYGYAGPRELIAELNDIGRELYVDQQRRDEFVHRMQEHGSVLNFESQVRRRDGDVIWISENARTVRDENGHILCFEGTVIDITERRAYAAQMHYQATHDALTGLPNRNLLVDRLQQAIHAAERKRDMVAVAFIDLDQFKFVNDSLGHQTGDALLKTVTARLTACMRAGDTVSRQGGDEFALLFSGCAGRAETEAAVRRVIAAVAEPWHVADLELQVTCSVGISLYPEDGADPETLLRHADLAMYRAKESGRNNFAFFDAVSTAQASERLAMLNSLRHALLRQEFVLHYQPRIEMTSGAVIGAEALVRWNHPSRGMVPPGQFIPLAEDSGLVVALGEWVLRTACAQNKAWQDAGLAPIPVSVNLSPRQLMRDDIVDMVADALNTSGMEARYLELEITETMVMHDVEQSLATLHRLKALGVSISIDDFGTGYSSLNYLKRFPVDTLKIDRSFVNDIAIDSDDAAIVKVVISLGHILQLRVVAEGVETEAQQRFLMENGCDEAQGYYFSRPLDTDAFRATCLVPVLT